MKSDSTVPAGFIAKTYQILSNPAYKDIISWTRNGAALTIKNLDAFTNTVLPQYFKHKNLPSFIRQLNMYGFQKTVNDSNVHDFEHPNFKRGQPALLPQMKRKSAKNNHSNSDSNDVLCIQKGQTDSILAELAALRRKSDKMEARLGRIETENTMVRMDNANLWTQLNDSKDKQNHMHQKLQKLLMFMYSVYQRNTKDNQKRLQPDEAAAGAMDNLLFDSTGTMSSDEFRDTLKFLCMDVPGGCNGVLNGSTNTGASSTAANASPLQLMETRSARKRKRIVQQEQPTFVELDDEEYKSPVVLPDSTTPSPPWEEIGQEIEADSDNCMKQLGEFELSLLDNYDAVDLDKLLEGIDNN